MENISLLLHTRKKLALVFTLLVFVMALILESLYFSYKYVTINHREETEFEFLTKNFNKRWVLDEKFPPSFMTTPKRFPDQKDMRDGRFLNFILYDGAGNISWYNINHEVNQRDIQSGVFWWYLIKEIPLQWSIAKILFFQKKSYNFFDYIRDLGSFFLLDAIFWVLFFVIGYRFVGKNLILVEKTLRDMNDFIHNASHELKTPLSVVSSNLQLLSKLQSYDNELIWSSLWEIKKIDGLILWLIDLSSIEKHTETSSVSLREIFEEITKKYDSLLKEKNISLLSEYSENVILEVNRYYMHILIGNIVLNAIKYNIENGNIQISLDATWCRISNTGVALSSWESKNIFKRFYKWDHSRNSEGFWIGLALVKQICDIYGWKVNFLSENGENTLQITF